MCSREIVAPVFLLLMTSQTAMSANLLNLTNQATTVLNSFASTTPLTKRNTVTLAEINRYNDRNHITHIRVQEYYEQYPVLNAQAVIHVSHFKAKQKTLSQILKNISNADSMNGNLFTNIEADLAKSSTVQLTPQQSERAIQFATRHFVSKEDQTDGIIISNPSSKQIVWLDDKNHAHWAYQVTFDATRAPIGRVPAKPTYIIDADDFSIYRVWDNIHTTTANNTVRGGGWGGNPNTGPLSYDGLPDHLPAFMVRRENNICYFETPEIIVKHAVTGNVMQYDCQDTDPSHNTVYWSDQFDVVNEGYSPTNDAMFSAQIIKAFYQSWYNVPSLIYPDGSEMPLNMNVHVPMMDNAYWDGQSMTFGDGERMYPLTELGIAAHEVSHGFTQQHSNLNYEGQSGGMNEAFSDMAAQVAESYVYNQNSWQLGKNVFKTEGEALRYMDQPSKDCYGKTPGTFCSIDNANQYYKGLDVHYSSGVYNRAFYLLSNMQNWNPRKAFDVMLHANASYWVSTTTFADGAACVIRAADDLRYDKQDVEIAFKSVGITDFDTCTNHD